MSNEIQLKVVKIVSPFQVVINAGSDAGLNKGQKVMIYAIGDMITDPDSGEELERLEIVKGTGRIIHLQNKISTIESDMVEETPRHIKRTTNFAGISSVFGPSEETEIVKKDVPFDEPQIGDLVRVHRS